MPLVLGSKLRPYQLDPLVHSDGRGDVYRGRDLRLGRVVAIKVLPVHISKKAEARDEFEREALALSLLDHPNICRLYDIGYQDELDYLIMEYLEGENLAERLSRGPLPLDDALKYAVEVCDGLDRAHQCDMIHRDLRTSTIMLTNTGAKLLDFGLAKLSRAINRSKTRRGKVGQIIGPLTYMAPELINGGRADRCSNIFTLGAILYEMFTGASPFPTDKVTTFLLAIVTAEPSFPDDFSSPTHHALQNILCKALQKKPDNRYQSVMEMLVDLQRVRNEVPTQDHLGCYK